MEEDKYKEFVKLSVEIFSPKPKTLLNQMMAKKPKVKQPNKSENGDKNG